MPQGFEDLLPPSSPPGDSSVDGFEDLIPPRKPSVPLRQQVVAGAEQVVGALRHPIDAVRGMLHGMAESAREATAPVIGTREGTGFALSQRDLDAIERASGRPLPRVTRENTPNAVTPEASLLGTANSLANVGLMVAPQLGLPLRIATNAGLGALNDREQRVRGAVAGGLLGEVVHGAVNLPKAFDVSEGMVEAATRDPALRAELAEPPSAAQDGLPPRPETTRGKALARAEDIASRPNPPALPDGFEDLVQEAEASRPFKVIERRTAARLAEPSRIIAPEAANAQPGQVVRPDVPTPAGPVLSLADLLREQSPPSEGPLLDRFGVPREPSPNVPTGVYDARGIGRRPVSELPMAQRPPVEPPPGAETYSRGSETPPLALFRGGARTAAAPEGFEDLVPSREAGQLPTAPTSDRPAPSAPVRVTHDVNDYRSGETFGHVTATNPQGEVIGALQYSHYDGVIRPQDVFVRPEYRRQGVATQMYDKLRGEWPSAEIERTMTTPEGGAFREAYDARRTSTAPGASETPSPAISRGEPRQAENVPPRAFTGQRKPPTRFEDARTEGGRLRPLHTVADDALVRELKDLEAKQADAEARAQYEWHEDVNFHTTEDGRSVPVATRKGGGASMQAKALQNLQDFQRIRENIYRELASRGIDEGTVNQRIIDLHDLDAALEREGLAHSQATMDAEDVFGDPTDFNFGANAEPESPARVARAAASRGEAIPSTPPGPRPSDLLNVAKLGLEDQTAEQRVASQLEQYRAMHEGQRQTFAEADIDRAAIVRELTAGNPKALSPAAAMRLSGVELLARRDVVAQNDALIAQLSKAIESGELPFAEHQHASQLLQRAVEQSDALLSDLVTGSSQKGRDLGLLRRIANRSLDPDVWLVQAKRMLGDTPLSDTVMADVRRLAREAADACGGAA